MFFFLTTVSWGPVLAVGGNSLTLKHRKLRNLRLQPLHRVVHSWLFSLPCSRDTIYPLRLDLHLLLFLKLGLGVGGSRSPPICTAFPSS